MSIKKIQNNFDPAVITVAYNNNNNSIYCAFLIRRNVFFINKIRTVDKVYEVIKTNSIQQATNRIIYTNCFFIIKTEIKNKII